MVPTVMPLSDYRNAIAGIESAGSGGYSAIGPVTNGSRPYGRYQVMDFNIGPWTRQVLGREMTPEQFLADPQAQDAVFDGIFGGYVDQYGPEGAARAWFGGPGAATGGGNRSDVLGTTVDEYGRRFSSAVGQGGLSAYATPQAAPSLPGGAAGTLPGPSGPQGGLPPSGAPAGPPPLSAAIMRPAEAPRAPERPQSPAQAIDVTAGIPSLGEMSRAEAGDYIRQNYASLSPEQRVELARSLTT